MRAFHWENFAALTRQFSPDQRRAASIAAVTHALHDGYTDLIYIMLPLWQAEFGLDYAALGLLRGVFVGAMASLQIPAGLASEKLGAALVLGLGTALAGLGYCLAGASSGFAMLLGALFIGGLGASTQHPIASALVARAFAGPRSLTALGTYNFAGDIGKMTVPATLSLMLLAMAWRPALAILGCLGFVLAAVIFVVTPRYEREGTAASKAETKIASEPAAAAVRVSAVAHDRHYRQRHAHGLSVVPAVRSHAKGREPADHRSGDDAGLCRRRRGQARLRLHRRAHRRHRHRLADRRFDRGRNPGADAAAASRRAGAVAADRHRAQRHVVGALRFGTEPGRRRNGGRAR